MPNDNSVIHASSMVDTLNYKPTKYPLPIPYQAKSNPLFDAVGSDKERGNNILDI